MNLKSPAYPGRVIVIGVTPSGRHVLAAYAVTGRSASSQARKIIFDGDSAWVRPTDEEILSQGNPDLLVYPAVIYGDGIAVGNGKQTETLGKALSSHDDPVTALAAAHGVWEFEPDAPNFTPRISGCLKSPKKAALGIIKRDAAGNPARQYFEFALEPGEGRMIATYTGENRDPLPSFQGEPLRVSIESETAAEAAGELYDALAPGERGRDFRVSAFCLFSSLSDPGNIEMGIVNRHEEER